MIRPEDVAVAFMFVALAVAGAFAGHLAYRLFNDNE